MAATSDSTSGTQSAPLGNSQLPTEQLMEMKDQVMTLAREVGRWAKGRHDLHHLGRSQLAVNVKTVPGDVVTEVDVEAQRRIAQELQELYPGFGLLGEEDLSQPGEPGQSGAPIWVIDPVDGTHNFVKGYPSFCVSIGLVVERESVLGVIYDAGTDAIYWAVKGQGAWREQTRITLTPRPLAQALIATNFTPASRGKVGHRDFFVALAERSAGVRASGSACRDFCFVAEGTVDLFWQFGLRAWDVAAGMVLTTEAGAEVRILNEGVNWLGGGDIDLLVAAPTLVDEALAVGLPHLNAGGR